MIPPNILDALKSFSGDTPDDYWDHWNEQRVQAARCPGCARVHLEWEIQNLRREEDQYQPPDLLRSIWDLESEHTVMREHVESQLAELRSKLDAEVLPALPQLRLMDGKVPLPSPLQKTIWELENSLCYATRLVEHEVRRREQLLSQEVAQRRKKISDSQLELRNWAVSVWIAFLQKALRVPNAKLLATKLESLSELVADRFVADHLPGSTNFNDWKLGRRAPTDIERNVIDRVLDAACRDGRASAAECEKISRFGEVWAQLKANAGKSP